MRIPDSGLPYMGLLIDCEENIDCSLKIARSLQETEAYKDRKDIFLENRRKGASSFI